MNIQGLQKVTLLDFPGKVACTVFLAGCNFRCPFCHNASLVTRIEPGRSIPRSGLLAFLKKRAGVLDGVCITGGEPLLSDGLEELLMEIREMGYEIKLDTNGTGPERLKRLADAGLVDYIAMDVKNSPAKYAVTTGTGGALLDRVRESVRFLVEGSVPYEFRTTVVRGLHERKDFEELGQWLRGAERYYLQAFVDSGDLISPGMQGYTKDIMEQALAVVRKYVPHAELRGV